MSYLDKLADEIRHPARSSQPLNHDEIFVLRKCGTYALRVLGTYRCLDNALLELLAWLLGKDMQKVTKTILARLTGRHRERAQIELEEALMEPNEEDYLAQVARLLIRHPRQLRTTLENRLQRLLARKVSRLPKRPKSSLEQNMVRTGRMLGLTPTELEVACFYYLISAWSPVGTYFEHHLKCDMASGRNYLLTALGISNQEYVKALHGQLESLDILDVSSPCVSLNQDFLPFFNDSAEGGLAGQLFRKVKGTALPLNTFLVDEKATGHLLALLRNKPATSTHVLLYGAPGTGKSSYARALMRKLKVPAFEITRDSSTVIKVQRNAITAAVNLTNGGEGSIVIVDEADTLLNTVQHYLFGEQSEDKSWLNQTLEMPGARMIWITNDVTGMEESVRRRFAFSISFKPFNRTQREQIWRSVLKNHGQARNMDHQETQRLATEYKVSTGAVDLAVSKAVEMGMQNKEDFLAHVRFALEAHVALLGNGRKRENKDVPAQEYSLDVLNVSQDIHALLDQAQAFDRHLRAGGQAPRNMNLLMYGPPGTGKSEFARYLAHSLDRPVLVKRSSDLLNMYVGESERNIALAFDEAESEGAVVVMDEADSLLGSRDRAQHSWEVSFTNEMLAGMERFKGILVATTNRLTDLDSACLRRFSCKLEFRCLSGDGVVAMYQRMLAPMAGQPMDEVTLRRLKGMQNLTPGDFKVVRDRFALRTDENLAHGTVLAALEVEFKAKRHHVNEIKVGF